MTKQLTDLMVRGLMLGQILFISLLAITGIGLLVGVMDRQPPFKMLAHERIAVCAGTLAKLEVPVFRDLSRPCDVSYQRFLYDSNESRVDLPAVSMPFEEVVKLEKACPGCLRIQVPIPPIAASGVYGGVAPGHGRVAADLEYTCNKGHLLHPIKLHTDILVDIRQCF